MRTRQRTNQYEFSGPIQTAGRARDGRGISGELCARRHVDRRSDTRARMRASRDLCRGRTRGKTGDPRCVQAWSPALAGARSWTRRRGRSDSKRNSTGTRRPFARGAGPPEGLLDARKDAARTRATTGGGHLALQSTAAAASSNSSQWSSVHDSSGCSYETPFFLSVSHARAHTHGRHPRVAPCITRFRPHPRGKLDGPARASSSSYPLARAVVPFRFAAF